jgi:antitoxin component HigA of HigAB toxin-antitoxin module
MTMVITTDAEYDQTITEINRLLVKSESDLSPEEDRLLELLSTLAETWEEAHYPIPEAPGYRILKHYMQVRGLDKKICNQSILGLSGVTSEIDKCPIACPVQARYYAIAPWTRRPFHLPTAVFRKSCRAAPRIGLCICYVKSL